MKKTILIFLIIILSFFSCSKKEKEQEEPYLAMVGDAKITQADFDKEFQSLPDYAQKMFEGKAGKERFLDEIIKKEIMYQEALKEGIDKGDEFQKKLEEFRKLSLISGLFEKEVLTKAKVSDQEIRDFFDKNKGEFTSTSQIRASHILVKTEEEANKILERLKKGEDFEDIATEASIDKATAKNGGDLGYFSRGQMVPEFEKAANNLEVGELSNPIKTPFGYHIIKVIDRKKGPVIEFDNVKDMIMQKLSGEKQKDAFDDYIAELMKEYDVEINKDELAKSFPWQDKTEEPQTQTEGPSESATEQPEELKTEQPADSETVPEKDEK